MSDQPDREVLVFNAALQLPPAERPRYLDEACATDPELRRRVEILLNAHTRVGSFLEQPILVSPRPGSTGQVDGNDVAPEIPGSQIGR